MRNDKDIPEVKREKMRQKELKSPSSSIHGSNLADLVGGLNWIVTGILIFVIIISGVYFSSSRASKARYNKLSGSAKLA